tara:strand:+ start:4801 stop:5484 length:684 start_codon:yes stop_codon:yes gene_type:complete
MTRSLAIIPVREGSKRLAKKNLKILDKKPLFIHTLECAIKSKIFDEIHISTESKKVVKICKKFKYEPRFMRPAKLASDSSTLNQVCTYVIKNYEKMNVRFDNFCILWATSPLRLPSDLKKAYLMLNKGAQAVVGVCEYDLPLYSAQNFLENKRLKPIFPDQIFEQKKTAKIVCDNGSFCFVKTKAFKKYNTWLPPKTYGYEMPKIRSIDLDTEEDFNYLKYLYYKNK